MKRIYLLAVLVFCAFTGFAQADTLKEVRGAEDYEKVSIGTKWYRLEWFFLETFNIVATEYKLKVAKKKAYQKLKVWAAMQGCNVAIITNEYTEDPQTNLNYSNAAQSIPGKVNVWVNVYTTTLPNFEHFNQKIGTKKSFQTIEKFSNDRYGGNPDVKKKTIINNFELLNIKKEDNKIILEGKLDGIKNTEPFRVIYFNDEYFTLRTTDKKKIYNIKVRF